MREHPMVCASADATSDVLPPADLVVHILCNTKFVCKNGKSFRDFGWREKHALLR